ncbi:hypothetical protein BKA19_3126 [Blastococcus saxobsidens]|uniref:Uncharacterized protein n=2 Tax=Blastococcus saxobsidens TaxID=138336 RepID=A0A4Q7YA27_9ACTN|nr:hypothetical protein BKA19_3126 [Blastococcus saxobsidens]
MAAMSSQWAQPLARLSEQLGRQWTEPLAEGLRLAMPRFVPHYKIGPFPELKATLDDIRRRHFPPNWPEDIKLGRVVEVIQQDGLPLVWVPRRSDLVASVLNAADRPARVALLVDHSDELIEDCRSVLVPVTTDRVASQLPLAPRAIDAFAAGHHEAAQALAVLVTDAALQGWITGNYEAVAEAVRFDPKEVPFTLLRLQAAVAPLDSFKKRYFGEESLPEPLSRNVVVHYADAAHFTRANALIALLLMASILRTLQDFEERADQRRGSAA